jgi:hypothetical protein
MKKLFFVMVVAIITATMLAQSPQKLSYQAIVRNSTNQLLPNTQIGMRISIVQGTTTGTTVYSETQTPTTNINGLASIEFGGGAGFDTINWESGPFYIKTETDITGATDYTITGTTQLLSTPYALYASKAGNGISTTLVSTLNASNITTTSASCGGTIFISTSDVTDYGVCWATTQTPTITNSKTTDGTGLGNFISNITGLTPGTTYYVRAYATNSTGTTYGNQVILQTALNVVFPTVTTTDAINISSNSSVSGGNVTSTGGGDVIARGVCWSINQNPTLADSKTNDGSGTGEFQSQISGMSPGKTYYVKAYATNSSGTGYGSQVSFTTTSSYPSVTSKEMTNIIESSAVANGYITSDGGSTVTERGVCFSTSSDPTVIDNIVENGTGTGNYTCALYPLMPNTTYYVRAYAKNANGIGYGDVKSFTTSDAYYIGFENGMPSGWSGMWSISTTSPFENNYCLKSVVTGDSIQFSRTVSNPEGGQISFFHKGEAEWSSPSASFYIDNILQATLDGYEGWTIHAFPVTQGSHTFKWINNGGGTVNIHYIDYILCTK